MIRCDYHVHSIYSDDSRYCMEDIILDAMEKGLSEICFTDHVDYGIKIDPMGKSKEELAGKVLNVDYPAYFEEISRLREKYDGRLVIRQGMEFGMQKHTIPQFEALFAQYPFDFIIMSCHQVDNKEFWNQNFQQGRTQKEYNERYYQEILAVIKEYKDYSVLGHLDLIQRYDMCSSYPFEKISPIIQDILKQVIADGKGIEVNTSSVRYGIKDLTPSKNILKLYRELGGEILTIGSDSHAPEHLGAYIEDTMTVLRDLKFKYYCTYEAMQPQYHKL